MSIKQGGLFGLEQFYHGCFPQILKEAGFINIKVEDATENVMPMLRIFYELAKIPYKIIKFLGLENRFINAKTAVEGYQDILKNNSWKYLIISATKP